MFTDSGMKVYIGGTYMPTIPRTKNNEICKRYRSEAFWNTIFKMEERGYRKPIP